MVAAFEYLELWSFVFDRELTFARGVTSNFEVVRDVPVSFAQILECIDM